MTVDYVDFHAAERPRATAIIVNGHAVTFAQLAADLAKFGQALRRLGVAPGSTVAVEYPDVFTHWLLLLAAERLGACSLSWLAEEVRGPMPFLASADLVLSQQTPPAEWTRRHHAVTDDWMRAVAALPETDPEPPARSAPEQPLRLLRSSGTTGVPLQISITRRLHEARIASWSWLAGLSRRTRLLVTLPFTVGGSHSSATAVLRAGGTVVFESGLRIYQTLAARAIGLAILPPIQLKRTLDMLPADFARPAELSVFSFGAPLAKSLAERALARLATEVVDLYGSNEAGFISVRRPLQHEGAGFVLPGNEVEIIDGDGRALPFGRAGRIRVRNEGLVSGYVGDPETTQRVFRDGWFYLSDAGILHGPRSLQVLGRADEVINIGWVKLAPETIETQVLLQIPAGDAAVCSLPNRDGIEEVCVAVAAPRMADRELVERVTALFAGLQFGRVHVVRLERIPRDGDGRIVRQALRDAVAAATPLSPPQQ
ncbi:MAG TPA: class I adenylate-forming enzyme family protein [Stellaceae bacterium]|nr:class I adenylate-forming enzyme family protein [Stellaceae bacterium]